jgi:hypothetical protein
MLEEQLRDAAAVRSQLERKKEQLKSQLEREKEQLRSQLEREKQQHALPHKSNAPHARVACLHVRDDRSSLTCKKSVRSDRSLLIGHSTVDRARSSRVTQCARAPGARAPRTHSSSPCVMNPLNQIVILH